jgi:HYR domain
MNRRCAGPLLGLVFSIALSATLRGQQATENVNVMPVWMPCDPGADTNCHSDPRWADAWKYGDIFLQRQVEGSVAPSSLNPNRVLTGFIDYSAVDTFSDTGLGDTVASLWTRFVGTLARLFHPSRGIDVGEMEDEEGHGQPKAFAGSDAWIRLTWSTNGGATGTPFFMPGAPWDTSAAGASAPYYGVATASSDPVVVAAPNGDFFVAYMAFLRGSSNWMMVARFHDLNIPDEPNRHGLTFLGFTTLAAGNNASFGTLHDKPHAIVVVDPASPVGYDVYVSYTLFNGNPGGSKFQSQLFVARSTDGGVTFTIDKINQSTNQNSGTWLVASPSGEVSAVWRAFGTAPAIFVSKRLGPANWTKPQSILDKAPFGPFDQGNIKVDSTSAATVVSSEKNITPRSNGFPSAAAAADGTLYVVFQECANPTTGVPLACGSGGSPRIMLTRSSDGGATWSARKAFDIAARTAEPDGQGFFWNVGRDNNAAHPQLMPSVACGAGRCMVTYWESRTSALTANNWIGGYQRLMDLRGAILNADGTVAGRSFQISRYPYRPGTRLVEVVAGVTQARPENVNDVARVNEIINADGTRTCAGPNGIEPNLPGLESGCVPRLNFYCRPQSGGGTTCFMGDYNAVTPATSFVRRPDGSWKAPTTAQEVPYPGFLTAASDNRNLLPPAAVLPSRGGAPPTDQLTRYTAWTHGVGGLPACEVGGSRNTDLMLAKVSFGLLLTAPVTAKTTPSPGDAPFLTFPLQVSNNTSAAKTVTFTIDPAGTTTSTGSFSKTNPAAKGGPGVGVVTINPFSSTTRVVYATTTAPIFVQVSDGASTYGITFNGTGNQPSAGASPGSVSVSDPLNISAENISAENISAENISAENISAENISAENISAENISAENISAENQGIQETTWVVKANGDPTKAYTALVTVDKAYSPDYQFHVVIYRLASIGACVDTTGRATVQYQATVVSNTGPANISAENISAENISAENISAENGFPSDSSNIINNSVFTAKPGKPSAPQTQPPTVLPPGGVRVGEGVDAQPPEQELTVVKLLAIPKKPLSQITTPFDPVANPAALTVSDYWCDQNCTPVLKGPDLVISGPPVVAPANVFAGHQLQIGGSVVPNTGTLPAGPRRYGYYLSQSTTLALDPATGLVDPAHAVLLGSVSFTSPLLPFSDPTTPGTTDVVPQATVTIPSATAAGTWYLFIYADDLRKVSELDETNNITPAATIVVTDDTTPPVIAGHADVIAEAAGPAGAVVSYTAPTSVDAVDGSVSTRCTPASGTQFALGSTVITCTASDLSGNVATSSFAVIVRDTTPPAIAATANIIVQATSGAGAIATYSTPVATDLVDGAVVVSCTPASGSTFPIGTTTVTCTALDTRGNRATSSFVVTVTVPVYGFIAVQNLPPPAGKAYNSGSAIPFRWQFTVGGTVFNSTAANPKITISGPTGTMTFTPQNPGNSSFQPPTAANGWTWQFNWQTSSPTGVALPAGTYSVSITSQFTGQTFSGGQITLK